MSNKSQAIFFTKEKQIIFQNQKDSNSPFFFIPTFFISCNIDYGFSKKRHIIGFIFLQRKYLLNIITAQYKIKKDINKEIINIMQTDKTIKKESVISFLKKNQQVKNNLLKVGGNNYYLGQIINQNKQHSRE